jgi:ADP-ribose pyrophosphatase YjhB (NUDIX family)
MTVEPAWLIAARELQAIAQTGLTFTTDPFDRERYTRLRELAAEFFHVSTGEPVDRILQMFTAQTGYATPKVDVRAAVFNEHNQVLMVREVSDEGRWTLPGGWADVNITPAGNVVKEVLEESGYEVAVTKLAAVWDRNQQGHPASVFSVCKMFFLCRLAGGAAATSLETSEVQWFAEDSIPADLSLQRVLPQQIKRMFEHLRRPDLATDYD